jgi:WD40 repeat protein
MDSWEVFESVFSDTIYETSSEVHSLCSSEDYICAGLRSGVIWVLDLSNDETFELKSHTNTVNSLSISSEKLISGGQDSSIFIWDLRSQSKVAQIPAHEGVVTGFDISSPFLFSSSIDLTIKKFNFTSVCKVSELKLESVACCVKVNNERLYLGCEEGFIEVLNLDLEKLARFEGHLDAIWCVDCFCDLIVSCSFDGTVRVWDSSNGSSQVIGEHEGVVNKIGIFDPSNTGIPLIVSAGSDKLVKLWALDGLKDSWKFHSDSVSAVVVLDMFLVTAGFDKKIRMWSLLNHLKVKKLESFKKDVKDFAVGKDFFWIFDGEVIFKEKEILIGKSFGVNCFDVDLGEEVVVLGTQDGIEWLKIDGLDVVRRLRIDEKVLNVVAKNQMVFASAAQKAFWISGEEVRKVDFGAHAADFNQDFVVCVQEQIKVLDKDLRLLRSFDERPRTVLISRNGMILYAGNDSGIKMFLLSDLQPLCQISLYQEITRIKLHPNSCILASSGQSVYLLPEYDLEKQMMLP